MKKIGIIGIGGRTGTMFYSELKKSSQVFGIGKEKDVELIKNRKVFIKKGEKEEIFKGDLIKSDEFPKGIDFDFLFFAIKNPVGPAIKYYYQKMKELKMNPPSLLLSQNGIGAGEEALSVLKNIFGKEAERIQIIRISLFNPVDKKTLGDKIYITYSLPIKLAIAKFSGKGDLKEIFKILKGANFEIELIPEKDVKNMEYSKLFLNLIGMASASRNLSLFEGFSKKEVFEEEILALKEYIKVIKKAKGKFLNFRGYPVKFFSLFFSLPILFLLSFRKILGLKIEKGREGKPKDLTEIDYYNGAVVKLGRELKIETPTNKKILERAKLCLSKE